MKKIKKYGIKQLRKIMPKQIIKQFICTPLIYKDTKEKAMCQITDCFKEAGWITIDKKENSIVLCFGHGEEL